MKKAKNKPARAKAPRLSMADFEASHRASEVADVWWYLMKLASNPEMPPNHVLLLMKVSSEIASRTHRGILDEEFDRGDGFNGAEEYELAIKGIRASVALKIGRLSLDEFTKIVSLFGGPPDEEFVVWWKSLKKSN